MLLVLLMVPACDGSVATVALPSRTVHSQPVVVSMFDDAENVTALPFWPVVGKLEAVITGSGLVAVVPAT